MSIKRIPRNKGGVMTPIAILIAGLAIAAAIFFNRAGNDTAGPITVKDESSNTQVDAFIPVDKRDHILGDIDKADLIIVDYSDLECPYCKMLHESLNRIYAENKASGRVAWVYRHFPLSIHSQSSSLAQAAECAADVGGEENFWPFIDKVFEASDPNASPDPKKLPVYAGELNIDVAKFNACLASGKYAQKAKDSYDNAIKMTGVEITPFTVFVSKGRVIPIVDSAGNGFGALPYQTMSALVKEFLATSGN